VPLYHQRPASGDRKGQFPASSVRLPGDLRRRSHPEEALTRRPPLSGDGAAAPCAAQPPTPPVRRLMRFDCGAII